MRINNPSITSFSTADYCKADIAGPDIEEYHVLVKKGCHLFRTFKQIKIDDSWKLCIQVSLGLTRMLKPLLVFCPGYESSTVQWCPTPLLGRFTYVHNDGTSDSCSASSELQVCPSWTRMTFDYTKCTRKQAFSSKTCWYLKIKIRFSLNFLG